MYTVSVILVSCKNFELETIKKEFRTMNARTTWLKKQMRLGKLYHICGYTDNEAL